MIAIMTSERMTSGGVFGEEVTSSSLFVVFDGEDILSGDEVDVTGEKDSSSCGF